MMPALLILTSFAAVLFWVTARRLSAQLHAAEAKLVRVEPMASIATLVRGIGHELNNPIGFIAANIGPLQRYSDFLVRAAIDLSDGKPRSPQEVAALTRLTPKKDLGFVAQDLARITADIAEGARRARLIITDLQSLTTTSHRRRQPIDLHKAVHQTVSLLGARVPPGVRIEIELGRVPLVVARSGELEQVLVNLIDNAIHAVGDNGLIRVQVSGSGERVRLSVRDDGPGMTPKVKQQACEPFFTTRAPGEGSGLGLAIVASIVRGHQGTLSLTSEIGSGTEVAIELPVRADFEQGVLPAA